MVGTALMFVKAPFQFTRPKETHLVLLLTARVNEGLVLAAERRVSSKAARSASKKSERSASPLTFLDWLQSAVLA